MDTIALLGDTGSISSEGTMAEIQSIEGATVPADMPKVESDKVPDSTQENVIAETSNIESEQKIDTETPKLEPEEKISTETPSDESEKKVESEELEKKEESAENDESEKKEESQQEEKVEEKIDMEGQQVEALDIEPEEFSKVDLENVEQIAVPQVSAYARAAAAEVKTAMSGKWKLDRNDNYDAFLREIGVNFMMRKVAAKSRPSQLILVNTEDATIKISNCIGVWSFEGCYIIGEEYEREVNKVKVKGIAKWEDNELIFEQKPDKTTPSNKCQTVHRKRVGDELLLTIYIGKVVCKRYYKPMLE